MVSLDIWYIFLYLLYYPNLLFHPFLYFPFHHRITDDPILPPSLPLSSLLLFLRSFGSCFLWIVLSQTSLELLRRMFLTPLLQRYRCHAISNNSPISSFFCLSTSKLILDYINDKALWMMRPLVQFEIQTQFETQT